MYNLERRNEKTTRKQKTKISLGKKNKFDKMMTSVGGAGCEEGKRRGRRRKRKEE